MDPTPARCFPPIDDRDLALSFYRDFFGHEPRDDLVRDGFHCITVGAADESGTAHLPERPAQPQLQEQQ